MIKKLKRYFRLACRYKDIPKKELLSTNEALKYFGKLWGDDLKGDTMMMLAVIEHEYIADGVYSPEEAAAVKRVLGKVGLFFRDCKEEWDAHEERQARKVGH